MITFRFTDAAAVDTSFARLSPTMFPDGTSQVWKLAIPDEPISIRIVWEFEGEDEVFHLLQLLELANQLRLQIHVHAPFLPYGRQDKMPCNESTFALSVLGKAMGNYPMVLSTIDAHSTGHWFFGRRVKFHSFLPRKAIEDAFGSVEADCICYPDESAMMRYGASPAVFFEKHRDQSTGTITGMSLKSRENLGERILIVDDICDGGRTFIEASKALKEESPGARLFLYVSHGIFSKGTQCLVDAGIERIFTHKGEVKL